MPTITPGCFFAISAAGAACHVREVLLVCSAAHAVADDVEEGEHARLRAVDDAVLKSSKLRQPAPPASTTVVTPTRNVKPSG